MKRVLWILIPLSLTTMSVAQDGGQTGYTVVSRSAHETVWQRVSWTTNRLGVPVAWTNAFLELATGLNHVSEATGQYEPSREEWVVYPDAIVAQAGRHKVILGHNLNLGGSVDVLLPSVDGLPPVRLISNPVGFGFYDPVDGQHQMLAEIKDCSPRWGTATNEIIFPDCFDGFAVRFGISTLARAFISMWF